MLKPKNIEPELQAAKGRMIFEMRSELTNEEKEIGVMPKYCKIQVNFLQVPDKKGLIALDFQRREG